MRRLHLATAALSTATLVGCADMPAPTRASDERPFASICDAADPEARVAVRGYLRLPDESTGNYDVILMLHETAAYDSVPLMVPVRYGYEPNQIASIPTSYSDADLRVFTADGDTIRYGEPVRVSGRIHESSPRTDVACGIENPYVEAVR